MNFSLPRSSLLLAGVLLAVTGLCFAAASEHGNLRPPYRQLVPLQLAGGLALVDLNPRTAGPAWREVDVHAADGASSTLRVSVAHGVRAMYAFPGEEFYANVKVETSVDGQFAQDRKNVLAAMDSLTAMMKEKSAGSPRPDGLDVIEDGKGAHRGIEYHFSLLNTVHGKGMVVFFLPEQRVIITAYLLGRKPTGDGSVNETRRLQRAFVHGYIDAIAVPGPA